MTTLREAAQQALEALKNNAGEMRVEGAISILETALAQQAEPTVTEDMKSAVRWAPSSAYWSQRLREFFGPDAREGIDALERRLAKAQQAEPVAGKVVAWGVFANIDGEWQLQHPVFAGDEQGKVNAEFERASYSGPQPLEVRPLGVVTATAQQAEPAQDQRCRAEPRSDGDFVCDCKIGECPGRSAALAQQAEPIDTDCHAQGICQRSGYGIGQQAEPVEPVAHRAFLERILTAMEGVIDVADRKTDEFDALRSCVIDLTVMLHTAPPQRKPLTEEEIYRATGHCGVSKYTAINITRAVELAHGIKEN